jgi:hypothetical protein
MKSVVAGVITAIWAALYIRKIIDPTFPVPPEVTGVMLLAAAYLFNRDFRKKLRDKADEILSDPEDDDDVDRPPARKPRAKGR